MSSINNTIPPDNQLIEQLVIYIKFMKSFPAFLNK